MHDLRDYKTLSARQLTAAIGQLNHNTAPKIMTHLVLAGQAAANHSVMAVVGKALKLLRRVKKAHKAGVSRLNYGDRLHRPREPSGRPFTTTGRCWPRGWQRYDTEEDAWYFGIWINTEAGDLYLRRGDTSHVIAPNVEAFRAELARWLYQYHPQAPAFIGIDPEAGVVTHHFEAKPEV